MDPETQNSQQKSNEGDIPRMINGLLDQFAPQNKLSQHVEAEELDSFLEVFRLMETSANRLLIEHSHGRNSFVPMHQLPVEVIAQILHTALQAENYYWKGRKQTVLHRQNKLRLVCSHWNEVIKSTPIFWSAISCADFAARRLKIALVRSGNTSLSVFCRPGAYIHCKTFGEEISKVSHRWHTLDIHGSHWAEHLNSPLSSLVILRAQDRRPLTSQISWRGNFLGGSAPNLRELVFKDFVAPWDAFPILPSLKRLEIRSSSIGPTATELVNILSLCPQLSECIVFQTPMEPLAEVGMWSVRKEQLDCPNLQRIEFDKVRLSSVVQVLNSLQLSATCRVKVTASNLKPAVEPFLDYVCQRMPELDLGKDVADTFLLYMNSQRTISFGFPGHTLLLFFTLSDASWDSEGVKLAGCSKILKYIRPAFSREPGPNLWLYGRYLRLGMELIRDNYPNIERLCLISDLGTLPLLSRPQPRNLAQPTINPSQSERNSPKEWLFPKLEDLHLYGPPKTNGLLEFIESRRSDPEVKPIKKLVVDNSDTPVEVQEKLKEFVADLRFRKL